MRELRVFEGDEGSGYILENDYEANENEWDICRVPIENTGDDMDALRRMLERVAEYFGVYYDKFSPNNLNITFDKKGHKVE